MGTAVTTVLEAEDEEAEVIQKLEQMEMHDDGSVIEVPVIVESAEVEEVNEDEPSQPDVRAKEFEITPEESEDARPKTAYLDKGFPDILDEKESTEGTQETLVEEKLEAATEEEKEKEDRASKDKGGDEKKSDASV